MHIYYYRSIFTHSLHSGMDTYPHTYAHAYTGMHTDYIKMHTLTTYIHIHYTHLPPTCMHTNYMQVCTHWGLNQEHS